MVILRNPMKLSRRIAARSRYVQGRQAKNAVSRVCVDKTAGTVSGVNYQSNERICPTIRSSPTTPQQTSQISQIRQLLDPVANPSKHRCIGVGFYDSYIS